MLGPFNISEHCQIATRHPVIKSIFEIKFQINDWTVLGNVERWRHGNGQCFLDYHLTLFQLYVGFRGRPLHTHLPQRENSDF